MRDEYLCLLQPFCAAVIFVQNWEKEGRKIAGAKNSSLIFRVCQLYLLHSVVS